MILQEIHAALDALHIPAETGLFSKDEKPGAFAVIIPLFDEYDLFLDNEPHADVQQARVVLYVKGNYLRTKRNVEDALRQAGMTVTERRYVSYNEETGCHQYAIDAEKYYYSEA